MRRKVARGEGKCEKGKKRGKRPWEKVAEGHLRSSGFPGNPGILKQAKMFETGHPANSGFPQKRGEGEKIMIFTSQSMNRENDGQREY